MSSQKIYKGEHFCDKNDILGLFVKQGDIPTWNGSSEPRCCGLASEARSGGSGRPRGAETRGILLPFSKFHQKSRNYPTTTKILYIVG